MEELKREITTKERLCTRLKAQLGRARETTSQDPDKKPRTRKLIPSAKERTTPNTKPKHSSEDDNTAPSGRHSSEGPLIHFTAPQGSEGPRIHFSRRYRQEASHKNTEDRPAEATVVY